MSCSAFVNVKGVPHAKVRCTCDLLSLVKFTVHLYVDIGKLLLINVE